MDCSFGTVFAGRGKRAVGWVFLPSDEAPGLSGMLDVATMSAASVGEMTACSFSLASPFHSYREEGHIVNLRCVSCPGIVQSYCAGRVFMFLPLLI